MHSDAKNDFISAYVSLGSNQGDAAANLQRALALLPGCGCQVGKVSSVYETEPQEDPGQPWFLNQVAELLCPPQIDPWHLLACLLRLEQDLGRVRDEQRRYGPRVIDLDLLLYGSIQIDLEQTRPESAPQLILPHPRLARRAFVLVPLHEIAPSIILPNGQSVQQLLAQLPHQVSGRIIYQ